jgi:hypothetical protein
MKEIKREVRGGKEKKKDLAARHRCKYGNISKTMARIYKIENYT